MAAPSPHVGMGAIVHDGGCTFRCWAPNASAVSVSGLLAGPAGATLREALARDDLNAANSGFNYWSAFVPGAKVGGEYRFEIQSGATGNGNAGQVHSRMDPYCRDATSSTGNSIICDQTFDWGPDVFRMPNWNEMVIYELHIGTFNTQQGKVGTFADALNRLKELQDKLGVNAIEVMPAEDFDTPTSMGYNPGLPFAIDDAYGRSKAVQAFVKQAHADGIAVIFDVVYNHFGPEGLGECLWEFDGWSQNGYGGIYLYNDFRASCAWGEKNRPDFGRPELRQFLRDNAMMWLAEYRADGLRFDSAHNIHRFFDHDGNDHGPIAEGAMLLQWINDEKNRSLPWNISIAENFPNTDWATRPTSSGGAGFDAQWDTGFRDAVRNAVLAPDDANRDLGAVAGAIGGRYNGNPFQRVIYVESHDEAKDKRLPEAIWPGNAAGWAARKRSTLAAAIVFTSPGIPMLFQGQEFLEWGTWNTQQALDWSKATTFAGIRQLYQDLIGLRRNLSRNTRGLMGPNVNVFHVNQQAKVIAFHRWFDGGPGDDVIVVANFSTQPLSSYNIGFPTSGNWFLRFNSDWSNYSGDFTNVGYDTTAQPGGNMNLPCNGNVGVGAYSAIVLSQ